MSGDFSNPYTYFLERTLPAFLPDSRILEKKSPLGEFISQTLGLTQPEKCACIFIFQALFHAYRNQEELDPATIKIPNGDWEPSMRGDHPMNGLIRAAALEFYQISRSPGSSPASSRATTTHP